MSSHPILRRVAGIAGTFAALGLALGACAQEAPGPAPTPSAAPVLAMNPEAKRVEDLPEGVNAVQNEMRLLDAAMRDILTLLANKQLDAIPKRIFAVHGARDLTEQALASGAYRPPRGDVAAFGAVDTAFHDQLVRMVKASRAGDLQGATDAYADAVRGCASCHESFCFPAP